MNQQTIDKVDRLLKIFQDPNYPEDLETIREWRNKVQTAILKKDLMKHEAIQMIIDYAKDKISDIITTLQTATSDKLPDTLRDRILFEKDMWRWFLGIFKDADKEIKEVEQAVEEELSELEK